MGASKSKTASNCYLNTKQTAHCCLDDCFKRHKLQNVTKLQLVTNLQWCFTRKHEAKLRQCLSKHKLEDITAIIMQYLENYKMSSNEDAATDGNYRAFIRTKLSLLSGNAKNRRVCDIWYEKVAEAVHSYGDRPAFKRIKCVMCGAGGVGKSTLTIKFIQDEFLEEYDPTIEDSYYAQFPLDVDRSDIDKNIVRHPYYQNAHKSASYEKYAGRQQIFLDILDTAGREEFASMYDQWFREGHLFFIVFDVMQKETFTEVQRIYDRILIVRDPAWDSSHSDTQFGMICVANKCDLRDNPHYAPYRNRGPVDMDEAMKWCEQKGLPCIETSAKNGKNVNFLFRHAVFEYWVQSHSGCMPYC